MSFHDQILLEFVDAIFSCHNKESMFPFLEVASSKLGFDNISYTYIPAILTRSLSTMPPVFQVSRSYEHNFIEHYVEAGFGQYDFVIKKIFDGELSSIIWWDQKGLTNSELEIIQVARNDYRITHGVSIPTLRDNSGIAVLSATSECSREQFSFLCNENLDCLRKIARMYSDRLLSSSSNEIFFFSSFAKMFSLTERHVLRGLADNKKLKVIAHDLGLDYKYIANSVIKSLRDKFGGVSRDKMLLEAGLLDIEALFTV